MGNFLFRKSGQSEKVVTSSTVPAQTDVLDEKKLKDPAVNKHVPASHSHRLTNKDLGIYSDNKDAIRKHYQDGLKAQLHQREKTHRPAEKKHIQQPHRRGFGR